MTPWGLFVALLVALLAGWAAQLVSTLVDFARPHAATIGVLVALAVFLSQLGWL